MGSQEGSIYRKARMRSETSQEVQLHSAG